MVSLRLTVFLMITLAYASGINGDDEVLDVIKETTIRPSNKTKERTVPQTTESKGLFDSFKEKVSGYYDKAVEKTKDIYEATADAVSNGYDKIKETFVEKSTTSPIKPTLPTMSGDQI